MTWPGLHQFVALHSLHERGEGTLDLQVLFLIYIISFTCIRLSLTELLSTGDFHHGLRSNITQHKTHVRRGECHWSAQSHKAYRPSYLTAVRLFSSFPQVLGVNAAGHVMVAWLWSLRMPQKLQGYEQPAPRPSSGLGITVLTTSHTAQPYSSISCTQQGRWRRKTNLKCTVLWHMKGQVYPYCKVSQDST